MFSKEWRLTLLLIKDTTRPRARRCPWSDCASRGPARVISRFGVPRVPSCADTELCTLRARGSADKQHVSHVCFTRGARSGRHMQTDPIISENIIERKNPQTLFIFVYSQIHLLCNLLIYLVVFFSICLFSNTVCYISTKNLTGSVLTEQPTT